MNQVLFFRERLADQVILSHNMHTPGITDDALTLDESIEIVIESNYLATIKAMMENGLGPGALLHASRTLSAL